MTELYLLAGKAFSTLSLQTLRWIREAKHWPAVPNQRATEPPTSCVSICDFCTRASV